MTAEERREYMRKWRQAHPDYHKKWMNEHADEYKGYHKAYYAKNKDRINARNQQPEINERRKLCQHRWWKAHKDELNAARRERYLTDAEYREKQLKRGRLRYRKKVLGR